VAAVVVCAAVAGEPTSADTAYNSIEAAAATTTTRTLIHFLGTCMRSFPARSTRRELDFLAKIAGFSDARDLGPDWLPSERPCRSGTTTDS
jgi:hypothetical protein